MKQVTQINYLDYYIRFVYIMQHAEIKLCKTNFSSRRTLPIKYTQYSKIG